MAVHPNEHTRQLKYKTGVTTVADIVIFIPAYPCQTSSRKGTNLPKGRGTQNSIECNLMLYLPVNLQSLYHLLVDEPSKRQRP